MVFSSLLFTFFFLPAVFILYYTVEERYRNFILLIASLLFYAYGEPVFVLVMLSSIAVNHAMGILVGARKRAGDDAAAKGFLILDVLYNLGVLFVFKYLDFSISVFNQFLHTDLPVLNIALPIGISFYTFQAVSYVADVYRGTVPARKSLLHTALYISFFPQLIAGPIVRYSDIRTQLDGRVCTAGKTAEGVRRFMTGFCKKVLIANNLALVSEAVFVQEAGLVNPAVLWLGSIAYTLQIYYDFSGYSDMAIGLGRMFGFEFPENFRYPYAAGTVTDFWRRWHISLSSWFRDYVYIPLGGSRVRVSRQIFNLFIVWLLTGLWHGDNYTFIAWGMFYFLLLVLEKYLVRPEQKTGVFRILWRVFTLLMVNFGWVLFNSPGISEAAAFLRGMLCLNGLRPVVDPDLLYMLREYGFFVAAGILFSTPIMPALKRWAGAFESAGTGPDGNRLRTLRGWICAVVPPLFWGFCFLWSVSYLVLGSHNPFIYYNF